jgi:hypothetical protein
MFFSFLFLFFSLTRMRAGAATGVVVGRACQYTTVNVPLYCTYGILMLRAGAATCVEVGGQKG